MKFSHKITTNKKTFMSSNLKYMYMHVFHQVNAISSLLAGNRISVPSSKASIKIIQRLLQLMHRCSHHVNIGMTMRKAVSVSSAQPLEQFCKLCKHVHTVRESLLCSESVGLGTQPSNRTCQLELLGCVR
ncbi:hypothetical protein ILYODFUR_004872 [Ilyodon furcidens]|uniref:Uncharacterized protein n=1 Tax=Ilyodon furcidens TaxID=33524 RepID=A0ABV0U2S0_9TELE